MFLLCAVALPAHGQSAAARQALQNGRLEAGKAALEKLQKDPRRRRYRDGWEAIERELDLAVRAAPGSARAPEAALFAARARAEQWEVSRAPADARAAEAAYRKVDLAYEGTAQAAQALLADVQLSLRTHNAKEATQAAHRLQARYAHFTEAHVAAEVTKEARTLPMPVKAVAAKSAAASLGEQKKVQLPIDLDDEEEDDSAAKPGPVRAGKTAPGAGREVPAASAHESEVEDAPARASSPPGDSDVIFQIVQAARSKAEDEPPSAPIDAPKPDGQGGSASAKAAKGSQPPQALQSPEDTVQLAAANAAHASKVPEPVAPAEPLREPEEEAASDRSARAAPAAARATEEESDDPSAATRARELRTLALSSVGGSLAAQLGLKIRKVVIDPGHGGRDTGAIGPHGVREKDVALAIARKVAARVRALGLAVVLTRTDDSFVSLDDRTRIANESKADLFVSIHCNAARQRKLSGVETWTLNVASDRYSARLAEFENAEAERTMSDLRLILADLATKANAGDARELAQSVQSSLVRGLAARVGKVRDHGVKQALFYVLLGAHMPSILIETAFISNPSEEARLKSARFQDGAAEAIARGVREFIDGRQRLARAP